eukprot:1157465-Pelagomonas_calceolata.AAC.1
MESQKPARACSTGKNATVPVPDIRCQAAGGNHDGCVEPMGKALPLLLLPPCFHPLNKASHTKARKRSLTARTGAPATACAIAPTGGCPFCGTSSQPLATPAHSNAPPGDTAAVAVTSAARCLLVLDAAAAAAAAVSHLAASHAVLTAAAACAAAGALCCLAPAPCRSLGASRPFLCCSTACLAAQLHILGLRG